MAKKVRTPPPPRRVQAPKVRTGRERSSRGGAPSLRERINPLYAAAAVAALVVAGVLIGVFATKGGGKPAPIKVSTVSVGEMAKLPGIQLGKPPWNAGQKKLKQRLQTLGIPFLSNEALEFHIHQHLDIYANGKPVVVPRYIGFGLKGQNVEFLAVLHTHDSTGLIHVESPTEYDYTLGQLFGVWGVRLSKRCVGGLCGSSPLHVWVNGKPFFGDPTRIVLTPHAEIAIAYGKPPAKVPTHYSFAGGL